MEGHTISQVHHKYRSQLLNSTTSKVIKVLMIGNNPREMGCLSEHLRNFQWKNFNVVATFDLKQGRQLVQSLKPDYILLDAALGEKPLKSWVTQVREKKQTQNIAIAVMKDNNSQLVIPGIQDFLLKDNIVSDTFALTVLNALKMKELENRQKFAGMGTANLPDRLASSLDNHRHSVAT